MSCLTILPTLRKVSRRVSRAGCAEYFWPIVRTRRATDVSARRSATSSVRCVASSSTGGTCTPSTFGASTARDSSTPKLTRSKHSQGFTDHWVREGWSLLAWFYWPPNTHGVSTVRVSLQREGQNLPRFYRSTNTRSKHSQCFTSAWGPESSTVLLITEHEEQAQPGFHLSVRARIFHGFNDHRTRGASTAKVSVLREGHNLLRIYWSPNTRGASAARIFTDHQAHRERVYTTVF